MIQGVADRNLLLGLLALQNGFVDGDTLVSALSTWVRDKREDLGQILTSRGALADGRHALLETLVDEHIRCHGGDPARSLHAVTTLDRKSVV